MASLNDKDEISTLIVKKIQLKKSGHRFSRKRIWIKGGFFEKIKKGQKMNKTLLQIERVVEKERNKVRLSRTPPEDLKITGKM